MATRTPVPSRAVRHTLPQPVLTARPKRFRRLRRLFTAFGLCGVLLVAGYGYLLQVYAPGLRAEAHRIPSLVHAQLAAQNAGYVPLSVMSPDLQNAIVAIEDRRFYVHPGIDPVGMVRAAWVNLRNDRVDQGGSTLEEQLVKRSLVPDDRSIHSKLRTVALAWAVDQDFSKRQVLELYLNAAYYGRGAYGAGAAAHVYFGTDVGHLTLAQAAFLAALPQAPSIYGAHPTSAAILYRQHVVLEDMASAGYITSARAHLAEQTPLRFAFPNP